MSDKKPGHSGKLMQLRFMQRAVEKKKMEEAVERQAAAVDAEEETDAGTQMVLAPPTTTAPHEPGEAGSLSSPAQGPGSSSGPVPGSRRCVVVYEAMPLPGAAPCGRMSFQGFNPATERLQAELSGVKPKPPPAPAQPQQGVSVSDAQMADSFRKPAALAAWAAPSGLKVYDDELPAASSSRAGGAAASGGSRGGGGAPRGGAQAPADGVLSLSAASSHSAGGSRSPDKKKAGKGKGGGQAPPENPFAPLRPAKKPKVAG